MNTYIIYDEGFSQQADCVENQLSVKKISYHSCEKEMEFHDWLTLEFKQNDIQLLIIPLSLPLLGDTGGLLLGLHIRLNYQLPIEKRSIPIVFISNLSFENILTQSTFDGDNNPQNLLLTEGIYISSDDIDEIKEKLDIAKPLSNYNSFLRQLNIRRSEDIGGHDIANAWGCYKLAQVAENKDDIGKPNRIKDIIFRQEFIAKHLKQLYAKYLICRGESFNDELRLQMSPLKCQGKQILFIDDKADEGWGTLMQYVFNTAGAGFTCVDPSPYKNKEKDGFTDFDGFIAECKSHIGKRWDLVIIDLRLNPETEDIDNGNISPDGFSGYKLIDEFLNENAGYQIMVSTASNKIWNINAALNRGAKGYYVKESPEFNYPLSETKNQFENFRKEVEICFENAYLQDIFSSIETIKGNLETSAFEESIKKQLDLAFYLISRAEKDKQFAAEKNKQFAAEKNKQFAFAYVTLYQIIEIVTDELITKEQIQTNPVINKWKLSDGTYIHEFKWDSQVKSYQDLGEAQSGKEPFPQWKKMAGLVLQKWAMPKGDRFVRDLSFLIEKRNGFIHNDKTILDKQDKKTGKYLNHDIFDKSGFKSLFDSLNTICSYL